MQNRPGWIVAVALVVVALSAQNTFSAIVVSNIEMTSTSLSFDLSGTIDEGQINPDAINQNVLYVGMPGNGDWYVVTPPTAGHLPASWTAQPDTVELIYPALNKNPTFGGYALLVKTGANNFVAGDVLGGTFSVTNSSFSPADAYTSQWIVSVGYINESNPDYATQVGAAVPEPSSGLGAICLCATAGLRRRR